MSLLRPFLLACNGFGKGGRVIRHFIMRSRRAYPDAQLGTAIWIDKHPAIIVCYCIEKTDFIKIGIGKTYPKHP